MYVRGFDECLVSGVWCLVWWVWVGDNGHAAGLEAVLAAERFDHMVGPENDGQGRYIGGYVAGWTHPHHFHVLILSRLR